MLSLSYSQEPTKDMSSWLSLSLPNPFKSPDDQIETHPSSSPPPQQHPTPLSPDPLSPAGVQQDLSVLTQTIGRQLRSVAAFLAPPPSPPPPPHSDDSSPSSSQSFLGIKNDLVEIGGSFKSSLSLLSSNKAVTEISRFASNLLQFEDQNDVVEGDEEEEFEEESVGITEEVIDFVREISLRPECWTDFPLSLDEDFDMSDVQKDHSATIEHLVPSLTALRHKIKSYQSEEQFWMIYFILLLPRLNEDDSKLLSTPEIVEMRELLLQKLKNKKNAPVGISEEPETRISSQEGSEVNNAQGMKNPSQETELPAEDVNAALRAETQDRENPVLWLLEGHVDTCTSEDTGKQAENEDAISFSDLEDDDNDLSGRLSGVRRAQSNNKVSSQSESNDWVRLTENSGTLGGQRKAGNSTSEGEESNDWLTVDDVDLDS